MTQLRYHDQFAQFGEAQLTELATRDICASTVHLILTTAFFTGAAIGLAKPLKSPKKIYLASLHRLLEIHFGLSAENAEGMVESNARLYKRYVLIEKIYNAGAKAALNWHENSVSHEPVLKTLLTQYQTLSMSDLNIEGVKETKPAPVKIETIAQVKPAPEVFTSSLHWGRWLFWLLFIALFALLGFAVMFPGHIPVQLRNMLPAALHHLLVPSV